MFIIDPEGYLIYKGGIDDIGGGAKFFRTNLKLANNYINSAIESIVNKQNIVSDVTIPYGCSIKILTKKYNFPSPDPGTCFYQSYVHLKDVKKWV